MDTLILRRLSPFGLSVVLLIFAPVLGASERTAGFPPIAADIVRDRIDGIDVLAYRTAARDAVTIEGSLPAGSVFHPADNVVVPALTAEMLDKGTATEDKAMIARRLEEAGATIRYTVAPVTLRFSARCLAKDLPLVLSVLADELRRPALSRDQFGRAKEQLTGRYLRQMEDTRFRADNLLARTLFPGVHPNHPASGEELLSALDSVKLSEVKAFHAAHYGPSGMVLVAVGDVDPVELRTDMAKDFDGWTGGGTVPRFAAAPRVKGGRKVVFVADRSSVSVAWGEAAGLRRGDPDALAFEVGTAILGKGFTGRLATRVRDEEGLSYDVGAKVISDTYSDGEWLLSASFAPDRLAKGIASTRREILAWHDRGVTAEELVQRKRSLISSYRVGVSTTRGLAMQILSTVERGDPLSRLDDYPSRVDALTLDQVNGAIRRDFDPSRLVLVEAGTVDARMPLID